MPFTCPQGVVAQTDDSSEEEPDVTHETDIERVYGKEYADTLKELDILQSSEDSNWGTPVPFVPKQRT